MFTSHAALLRHFDLHGRDMGFASPEEYEMAAGRVIADPDTQSFIRSDLLTVYYNYGINDFVVVNEAGRILTYYQPEDGQQYWLEELDDNQ